MKTFSAGELDRRIELQSATVTNDPEFNDEIRTWATYATVWAKMEHHGARSEWSEGEASAREYAQFGMYLTIRWRDDVDAEDRILYEGRTFEIIGRPRELGRRQGLKIQVREIE